MRAAYTGEALEIIGSNTMENLSGEGLAGIFVYSHDSKQIAFVSNSGKKPFRINETLRLRILKNSIIYSRKIYPHDIFGNLYPAFNTCFRGTLCLHCHRGSSRYHSVVVQCQKPCSFP
jgi:hypothetical protein